MWAWSGRGSSLSRLRVHCTHRMHCACTQPAYAHTLYVQVVESIFMLQDAREPGVAADMRNALIDQLA